MDVKPVCLCVLVLSLQLVNVRGQDLTSPCPGVFDFDKNGNDGSTVHGDINLLKPDDGRPVSVLEVKINFSVAGPILNKYKGNISPETSNQVRKYNQGQFIKYRVLFPQTEKPPKVTALKINGDIICQGSGDELGEHISSLTLRHKSKSGAPVDKPVTSSYESRSTGSNTPTHSRGQTDYFPTPRPIALSPVQRISNTRTTTADCGLVEGDNGFRPLIHNGLSYERGEVPWLVAIYRITKESLSAICGGTLVSDRHVVTAAHCMYHRSETDIKDIVIKVGVHEMDEWRDVSTVITKPIAADKHESYNASTLENDIMVLTLDKRLNFTDFIRPACLWTGNTDLSQIVGSTGVVAGWGGINKYHSVTLDKPQMVRVPIVSTKECRASKSLFHMLTLDKTLCAGGRNGDGPCEGDSGGGLYLKEGGKWRLRGVVSISIRNDEGYTATPCNLNEYVVYTDTAQYLPWIRSILTKDYFD